jgi:hypothetical protein
MLLNREISSKNVIRNFSRSTLKNHWLASKAVLVP